MNVSLTPQLEAWIEKKVASGRYSSASEVIREALRLLEMQDQLRAGQLSELRGKIGLGIDQLERGQSTKHDDASLSKLATNIKSTGRKRFARKKRRA